MTRFITLVGAIAIAVTTLAPANASAQPPAATGLSANPGRSMNFSWVFSSGATWYYLWVTDSSGVPRHQVWCTASQLGCGAGQTTLCQANIVAYLLPGTGTWWVQTYSDSGGYGPWTAAHTFGVPGPLFALVAANGSLIRGNAVSSQKFGTGQYEVIFGRNIADCVYTASVGDPGSLIPAAGMAATAPRAANVNGTFIATYNGTGAAADRVFYLSVDFH